CQRFCLGSGDFWIHCYHIQSGAYSEEMVWIRIPQHDCAVDWPSSERKSQEAAHQVYERGFLAIATNLRSKEILCSLQPVFGFLRFLHCWVHSRGNHQQSQPI